MVVFACSVLARNRLALGTRPESLSVIFISVNEHGGNAPFNKKSFFSCLDLHVHVYKMYCINNVQNIHKLLYLIEVLMNVTNGII